MSNLIAYYDRMCCPVSFDIVSFLMWVERLRLERGHDGVAIEILPGPWEGFRRDHNWPYTIEERRNLLDRIVVPMCRMLRSCRSVVVHDRRFDQAPGSVGHSFYSMAFTEYTASYAMGIRPLRCGHDTPRASRTQMIVTITLREGEHWPERNSNLDVWLMVASKLQERGYYVVVVRDAAMQDDIIPGALVNVKASTDLVERANLYTYSDLNLFVNNGPAWFALALDVPAIIFRPITETTCWAHTSEAMKQCGIVRGRQMKGAPPHQRLSWVPETPDHILEEIDDYFSKFTIIPSNWPVEA